MSRSRPLPILSAAHVVRFWSKVDMSAGLDACWTWRGYHVAGYGMLRIDKRCVLATRVMSFLTTGRDPFPLCVCHRCDNPSCMNPRHFFTGTHTDNMRDMQRKGRANTPKGERAGSHLHPETRARGERQGSARLTAATVVEIRQLGAAGRSPGSIARNYGVGRTTVRHILAGDNWRHIGGAS